VRSLRLRKYRQRESRFLVEGIRIVEEALEKGAPLETLVYAPDLLVSERAQALVERVEAGQRLALSGEVFRSFSDRDQPQGIAAVMRIEERTLAELSLVEDLLVVVAHQLCDPGNLGSIIRTADGAGAKGIVVVEPSVDLYDPQTVRATMGSLFALPIVRLEEEGALGAWYGQVRASGLSAGGQRAPGAAGADTPGGGRSSPAADGWQCDIPQRLCGCGGPDLRGGPAADGCQNPTRAFGIGSRILARRPDPW